jgi:hypothetical protein
MSLGNISGKNTLVKTRFSFSCMTQGLFDYALQASHRLRQLMTNCLITGKVILDRVRLV